MAPCRPLVLMARESLRVESASTIAFMSKIEGSFIITTKHNFNRCVLDRLKSPRSRCARFGANLTLTSTFCWKNDNNDLMLTPKFYRPRTRANYGKILRKIVFFFAIIKFIYCLIMVLMTKGVSSTVGSNEFRFFRI